MTVKQLFRIKQFRDINDGDLFIGRLGDGAVIHAIKAFLPGEDDDPPKPFIVSVGPFANGDQPTIYEASILRASPVLDVSSYYSFTPSLASADLEGLNGYAERDLLGKVVLLDQGMYLGAMYRRVMQLGFLNVESGALAVNRLPGEPAMVSSRWRIEAAVENSAPEIILEHRVE